ncbi:MAG: sensor histidine kinase, partial [Oscillospiraceae bacterium]|nr:sensor histidine kinase [Oscillospiraceae bacterium]
MRLTIWYWFMAYVLLTFLLLWVFQGLFLQKFYDSMKTKDVIRLSDQLVDIYQNDTNWYGAFIEQEARNGVCIQILDRQGRMQFPGCVIGEKYCAIHSRTENHSREYASLAANSENGVYRTQSQTTETNDFTLIYARVIGMKSMPEAYLILNAPLVPVAATVSIIRRQLVIITLILVLIGFILSVVVSERLAKPIVRVTKDAEQLAHGRYDIQFNGNGYDEAERLAETLTYASHEINRVDTMQRDLIANASHDLRTPLTMLKAYAEMIRDLSGDNPVKRAEHLQVIIEETDRLTALVNDILDLSKLENGKLKLECASFDMEQRLNEIVDRYRGLSEVSGYTFALETDGPAEVTCDAGKIEQVICNLMNNAMNYTGEDKKVFVRLAHTDNGIRISVRDTGQGMDQETLSRIFDKYYRSENYKREVRGTGLGLSIVKAILRLHDYAFGVDSKVGAGSTFWFIIHPNEPEKTES